VVAVAVAVEPTKLLALVGLVVLVVVVLVATTLQWEHQARPTLVVVVVVQGKVGTVQQELAALA
jgi:uncharacterized membrane protein